MKNLLLILIVGLPALVNAFVIADCIDHMAEDERQKNERYTLLTQKGDNTHDCQ